MINFLFSLLMTILMVIVLRLTNNYVFPISEFLIGWIACSTFYVSYYLIEKRDEKKKDNDDEKNIIL